MNRLENLFGAGLSSESLETSRVIDITSKLIGADLACVNPDDTVSPIMSFDINAPVAENVVNEVKNIVSHEPLTEEEYKLLSNFIGDDAKLLVETACKVRQGIEQVIDRYEDGSVTVNTMWSLAGCLYEISPNKKVRIVARS